MHFLSIDFGTSPVKVAILDEGFNIKQVATAPYPYILLQGEKSEIDPEQLWAACYSACNQLDPDLRAKVETVCYDTFSPPPVFVKADRSLAYRNIITHMDRRSRAQTDYINKVVGNERYLSIAGILPFAGGAGSVTDVTARAGIVSASGSTIAAVSTITGVGSRRRGLVSSSR